MTSSVRLDRLLANLGYGSRREMQRLAKAGEIELDGAPLSDAGARIALSGDLSQRLTVSGEPLDPPPPLTLVFNKPLGVVCSHREAGRSIYELLPPRWRMREPALSTIGRLDADTSGLLLVTDDGGFLHRVISPKAHVAKVYLASLDRPLNGTESATFASGTLMLENETAPLKPAVLEVLSPTTARLTITEGRYHQVRRMFAAVANHVTALHRERIGGLGLPSDLAPGDWRIATLEELAAIFG